MVFIKFGSTKVVPARRRLELIAENGRGKVQTPRLVVQFKEKRSADGAVSRKRKGSTTGDLASNGKILGTFSLAGETSPCMT